MDKKELIIKAKEVFEANPKIEAVHFASDGMPFFNSHSAINHEKTLRALRTLPPDFNPVVITRGEVFKAKVEVKAEVKGEGFGKRPGTVEGKIEAIKASKSFDELEHFFNNDKRDAVIEAYMEQCKVLNQAEDNKIDKTKIDE